MPTKKKKKPKKYNNGNVYKTPDKQDNTDNVKQMIKDTFKLMKHLEDLVILHKQNKMVLIFQSVNKLDNVSIHRF